MGISKNLGGDRVGSGNKMNVNLHGFERSSHDLGRIWRSSIAPGVLIPFVQEIALNGDKWSIDLNTIVRTLPTKAPLFGSFKLQMDVYQVPIRLYINQLKNNRTNVGMKMADINLPVIELWTNNLKSSTEPIEVQQISQSSLMAYLGIRGNGKAVSQDTGINQFMRRHNALGHLAYLDIFKNYYANKQEKKAWVIEPSLTAARKIQGIYGWSQEPNRWIMGDVEANIQQKNWTGERAINIVGFNTLTILDLQYWQGVWVDASTAFTASEEFGSGLWLTPIISSEMNSFTTFRLKPESDVVSQSVQMVDFDLDNIDDIIELSSRNDNAVFNENSPVPMSSGLKSQNGKSYSYTGMAGLLVKTYQSDIYNNWVNTEWIDGVNGINAITSVDTSDGSFTMDTLNLAKKVYDMLNRIAVSGGTYEDWQEAVWGEKVQRQAQTPIYHGGASTEIVFNEVVSTAKSGSDELGKLAGKGAQSGQLKGGKITIDVSEPSIIMGIVSLTPRVDYSQGNKWFTNLRNMDNFHKPSLDGIGFQDLITEQMASWDVLTDVGEDGRPTNESLKYSAGKQPAWLNYMTAVNETYGDFANPDVGMFMTLNRKYDVQFNGAEEETRIKDLTTYIDPRKFNYVFANSARDAQNFWVQIAMDITARRKMSAKIIPNL